jgi:hypothetical protein
MGASGAHFRGNPNCLHQLLLRGAMHLVGGICALDYLIRGAPSEYGLKA